MLISASDTSRLSTSVPVPTPALPSDNVQSEGVTNGTESAPVESVKVTLSLEGKAMAAKEGGKNADIDASNLPEGVKKVLKVIREIQQQIQKKMDELNAIMKDQSLSDKEREAKIKSIQVELATLNSQLSSSYNDLNKIQNEMNLSTAERRLAGSLAMPKS